MRNAVIGATAAAAVVAGLVAAGPAPAAPPLSADKRPAKTASVHGEARISFIESIDHDIRFTIHAEQRPFTRPLPGIPTGLPTDARGTVRFSHAVPGGDEARWAEARVDCLVTSGRTATLTAVVTKSNGEETGTRLGFSVQQGGKGETDRLGFSWGVANVDPQKLDDNGEVVMAKTGTCMAPAPFTTVIQGGFEVVHTEIAKSPVPPEAGLRRG